MNWFSVSTGPLCHFLNQNEFTTEFLDWLIYPIEIPIMESIDYNGKWGVKGDIR